MQRASVTGVVGGPENEPDPVPGTLEALRACPEQR